MQGTLSPRDAARAIGVSESSLKRWVDDGLLRATRTVGGHRRIAVQDVVRFARTRRVAVLRPDLLLGGAARAIAGARDDEPLYDALLRDDRAAVAGALLGRFLAGEPLADLCDGPVRGALRRIGELWRHEARGILVEHRATDTMLQVLAKLRDLLAVPDESAPLALGGAPAGDPYLLPSLMAATVLAEVGWRDVNLGADVPIEVFARAIEEYRPALVWVSATVRDDGGRVARLLRELAALGSARQIPIVVGGQAADARLTAALVGVHHLGSMAELAGFARALLARSSERARR